MKMFWKVLGAAVLAVGFTPYHVEKDQETGEKRYQALLWQATTTPRDGQRNAVDVSFGFKKSAAVEEEPHLFSDELCVEYTGAPVTEDHSTEETPAAPVEETPVDEALAEETPVEEAPIEEAAAEETPVKTPEEENEDEA